VEALGAEEHREEHVRVDETRITRALDNQQSDSGQTVSRESTRQSPDMAGRLQLIAHGVA
jgi:hypothetical protein